MNEQEQRIAIAEACGLKDIHWSSGELHFQPQYKEVILPDYCNDLNAMHEAEKVLIQNGKAEVYRNRLLKEVGHIDLWCATAAQRAAAFLKAGGLWN